MSRLLSARTLEGAMVATVAPGRTPVAVFAEPQGDPVGADDPEWVGAQK